MNKKYEEAKKQGLNWQALLIEETQTELKLLIQKLVLENKTFYDVNNAVVKVVERTIEELESDELKRTAKPVLYAFATRIYNYTKQTFQGLNWVTLIALMAVANKTATVEQTRIVSNYVARQNAFKMPLDTIDEVFDASAYNTGMPLDVYSKDYMKYVKDRIEYLVQIQAKEDYTSRVTLRNIAEIQVRQERHEEELSELKENGVNLVWIVPHSNCSERCEHWQGKLYSLDGSSGQIDGISYQPLTNATDIYETTKSGKVYKNGCISGFNCRHTLEPYKKGNKPIEIPSKVIEKQRQINAKQRYYERGVREWKERALFFKNLDKKLYKQARAKAIWWNKRYIRYSEKNNVAYYPSRTDII